MTNNLAKQWKNLIQNTNSAKELRAGLVDIYLKNKPQKLEIILNSHCPNKCQHCIYHPEYSKFNKNMPSSFWLKHLDKLYKKFGFRHFIFCGRFLSLDNIKLLKAFKQTHQDITFGIIITDNICTATKFAIIDLQPDWIDVSMDGTAKAHDNQRQRPGSFRATLNMICQFRDAGIKRINILTCATTLNITTIIKMVKQVNKLGFKNFFIGAVIARSGWHIDQKLIPSSQEICKLAKVLKKHFGSLNNAYVEFELYGPDYAQKLFSGWPELAKRMEPVADHLEYRLQKTNSQLYIGYYPSSLVCSSHFIINSNGDILPPLVIQMSKIPSKYVFGNIKHIKNSDQTHHLFVKKYAFEIYQRELALEKKLLKGLI